MELVRLLSHGTFLFDVFPGGRMAIGAFEVSVLQGKGLGKVHGPEYKGLTETLSLSPRNMGKKQPPHIPPDLWKEYLRRYPRWAWWVGDVGGNHPNYPGMPLNNQHDSPSPSRSPSPSQSGSPSSSTSPGSGSPLPSMSPQSRSGPSVSSQPEPPSSSASLQSGHRLPLWPSVFPSLPFAAFPSTQSNSRTDYPSTAKSVVPSQGMGRQ